MSKRKYKKFSLLAYEKKVIVSVKYFLRVSCFFIEVPDVIIRTDPAMGKALRDPI